MWFIGTPVDHLQLHTWHSGLLSKFSELEFLTSLIKHISSFLSQSRFNVSVEGKMSTPREM
jgi:hypothetical protein